MRPRRLSRPPTIDRIQELDDHRARRPALEAAVSRSSAIATLPEPNLVLAGGREGADSLDGGLDAGQWADPAWCHARRAEVTALALNVEALRLDSYEIAALGLRDPGVELDSSGQRPPRLLRLVRLAGPAAAPPPPASPRREAAPAAALATTSTPTLDAAAMAAVLVQAARDGVPFCEECARAAPQNGQAAAAA
jgi:hypothetical protein